MAGGLLDSLQGWWENSCLKSGLTYVNGKHVFINNVQMKEALRVIPGSANELVLQKYNGVVERDGKDMRVAWNDGQIVWTQIGDLPDMYDPITKRGRFKYIALLGKGAHGVVCEAEDMHPQSFPLRRRVAIKVLRVSKNMEASSSNKRVLRLHCEYLWSSMFLHNVEHPQYSCEQGRLFLRYLEDHTGLPVKVPEEDLLAEDFMQRLEAGGEVAPLPYVVMELAKGEMSWKVFFSEASKRFIS
jgi:hypothetical protein